MKRRHLWWAALAAGAAGVGVGAWRWRTQAPLDGAEAAFWASEWQGLDGQPLSMARFRDQPLLLNFWATWCPPCVEELPMLNRFYAEQRARGWQVLGLAVDQPSAVQRFLQRMPLDFPLALAGLGGTELSRQLGNPSGGLPFTVVFGRDGRVAHRKLGQVKPEDLVAWAAQT
jgi:peroxiredoxin